MPGIVIQAIFDVMQGAPIDSRLVASDANERLSINYLYAGLKVYQTDVNRTYTYDGVSWFVEGSGIYGGSGSLIDNTFVDFGTVSNPATSKSYELVYQADTTGNSKSFLYNYFYRHTIATSGLEWKDIEFRHQYKYLDNNGTLRNSAYVSLNPLDPASPSLPGAIAFYTGTDTTLSEKMRISTSGKVGIGTNNPREFLQIATTSSPTSAPLVFHNDGSAVIGHNWYYASGQDQFFDVNKPSTKIIQSNGSFEVTNRVAGTQPGNYSSTLFATGLNNGRVGIRNINPSFELDVNGSIYSNRNIRGDGTVSGGTVSSDNISLAKRFELKYASNNQRHETYIASSQSKPYSLTVQNKEVAYSTLTSNYFHDVNVISTNVSEGNLFVQRNIQAAGYLSIGVNNGPFSIPIPTGSITNYETSTSLPYYSNRFYALSNTINSNFSAIPYALISNFTYTTSAYRVGALVHLTFEFNLPNDCALTIGSNAFYGLLFRFQSARFCPATASYGTGTVTKPSTVEFSPIIVEIFRNDPTGGGINDPAANLFQDVFYIRFRFPTYYYPTNLNSPINQSGVGIIPSGLFNGNTQTLLGGQVYRGTIVYKAN